MSDTDERNAVQVLASTPQKRINEVHRFSLLTIAFFGSIVCSFGYAFNIISGEMQVRYDLSMTDLSTIIAVGSCIGYFMIPWSFLYDYFGPRPLTIPAFTLFFIGQLCMAFCFNGNIAGNVARLTVFNVFASVGFTMYEFLNSLTIMGHFPVDKGAVIGLIKIFTGLGTSIVGTIQIAFFAGKTAEYFYFLAGFGGGVGIPMVLFMKHPSYILSGFQMRRYSPEKKEKLLATKAQYMKQRPPRIVFLYAFIILFVLIVYLPVQSALVNYLRLGSKYKVIFAVVLIIILALAVLVIPLTWLLTRNIKDDVYEDADERRENEIGLDDLMNVEEVPSDTEKKETVFVPQTVIEEGVESRDRMQSAIVLEEDLGSQPEGRRGERQSQPPQEEEVQELSEPQAKKHVETEIDFIAPQYQTSFFRNLLTLRLWALFWSIFATVGPELSITFNATYMYNSVAETPQSDSTRILLSVLNGSGSAIGRLSMSFLEYWSQKKTAEKRIPITFTLYVPCSTVILALILFLTIPANGLPAAFTLNSYGNGFLNACMVLVARTIFAKDPAKHHHIAFVASSFASLIFTRFVFAEWYAKEALKIGDDKICYQKVCTRVPHIIMLCFTCSGLVSITFLHLKYSRFCRRVIAERNRLFQEQEANLISDQRSNSNDTTNNNNNNEKLEILGQIEVRNDSFAFKDAEKKEEVVEITLGKNI